MTEQEILDNNKLIADFMSVPCTQGNDPKVWRDLPCPFYGGAGSTWNYNSIPKLLPQIKYHSSWDWLMPVVININLLEDWRFDVNIKTMDCDITDEHTNKIIVECSCEYECCELINSVYNAVVKFIKWYNENK